jgi:hypothetical protein
MHPAHRRLDGLSLQQLTAPRAGGRRSVSWRSTPGRPVTARWWRAGCSIAWRAPRRPVARCQSTLMHRFASVQCPLEGTLILGGSARRTSLAEKLSVSIAPVHLRARDLARFERIGQVSPISPRSNRAAAPLGAPRTAAQGHGARFSRDFPSRARRSALRGEIAPRAGRAGHAAWSLGSRARAMGGASNGRPRWPRIVAMVSGSVMSATILRRPPQGHARTSSRYTRRSSEAQDRPKHEPRLGERGEHGGRTTIAYVEVRVEAVADAPPSQPPPRVRGCDLAVRVELS